MGANLLYDREQLPAAFDEHFKAFSSRVLDADFPCFFAPDAIRANQLLYGLADVSNGYDEVAFIFEEAASVIHKNEDQVVVVWLMGTGSASLADDRRMTRELLLHLLRSDSDGWPSAAPTDPNDPHWNFWHRGVDFFINVSTTNHTERRSRNLGEVFTLVIQSRKSFDNIPGHNGKIRERIRRRVARYDSLPPSPSLGSHGASPELPQFFLGDENNEARCPHLLEASEVNDAVRK